MKKTNVILGVLIISLAVGILVNNANKQRIEWVEKLVKGKTKPIKVNDCNCHEDNEVVTKEAEQNNIAYSTETDIWSNNDDDFYTETDNTVVNDERSNDIDFTPATEF